MAESSLHFNWDDFDAQIADALAEHEILQEEARICIEGIDRVFYPGEIGGVTTNPTS